MFTRSPTAPRSILRDHDFRLLWIGETISQAGSSMTVVALPLVAIFVLGASPLVLGVLTAAAWLPALLVSLPAGAWVDQLGRRKVMQVANLASVALFVSVPVAAWHDALTLTHLVLVAFAGGVARIFLRTAFQAYLPTVVPRTRLTAANSWLSGSESAAEVGGPGLAGALAQAFGAVTAVLVDGLSFAVAALCIWRIRAVETVTKVRDNTGLLARIGAGWRYTFADPLLRTMALFAPLGNFTQAAMQTLLVVFLVRTVGVSAGTTGVLLAGMGIGGLAGAALASPMARRFGTARTLLWCGAATLPFALLIPLTAPGPRLLLFPAGLTVLFIGVAMGSVIGRSFRQGYVPDNMLARSSATMSVLGFGAIPVGALAGGWLGTAIGVHAALWAACLSLLVPWFVVFASPIRKLRDLPVREPDPMGQ
jgi:MFS family permease